jgi:hypothetical protein
MSLVDELLKGLLPEEEKKQTTAVYAGGFKPPTSGHFEVVEEAIKQNPEIDEFIIFIGSKERNGISQAESLLIWEIYNNYLPFKVKIEPTSVPPIKAVYNFAKDHPTREVLWVIGAREGNEEDFKDISSRTKSITKYPNLELRTIVTTGGVSGTAARNASKISLDKFKKFVPDVLSDGETEEVFNIVADKIQEIQTPADPSSVDPTELEMGVDVEMEHTDSKLVAKIIALQHLGEDPKYYSKLASLGLEEDNLKPLNENASYKQHIDIKQRIKELTKHMLDKGMGIQPLPKVIFKDGDNENAKQFLGKTAYYDPNNQSIVLYTEGRHPKDIVRSFAHEMIHHIQNLEGRLENISTTNTHEDDHLNDIEAEANLKGTMTFRNWTDSLNEGKQVGLLYHVTTPEKLKKILDSNTLKGSYISWDGGDTDFLGISTTRNKNFLYDDNKIQIVLNGDKISNNYKIQPYDYWGREYNIPDEPQIKDEDEEIIKVGKDGLKNVKNYIIKINDFTDSLNENILNEAIVGEKIECDNCGWSWNIVDGGDDLFICHKCGYDSEFKTSMPVGENKEDPKPDYKIYLDMDGVVADFEKRFKDLSGMAPREFEDKFGRTKFWDFIDEENKVGFWVGIPVMDGAKELVDYVSKHDYVMLTAPSIKKQSRLGKRLWVRNHVGDLFPSKPQIIFKFSKEKHKVKPNLNNFDILIDDRQSTIDNWNNAGGNGILYQSASQVIADLKKLGL